MVIPWSMTSAAISGWVCSSAVRTTSTIWLTGSLKRIGHLGLIELDLGRHAAPDIASAHQRDIADAVGGPNRRADFHFHALGRGFADQEIDSSAAHRS